MKPCAPGAVKGGPKPAAQLPAAVPFFLPPSAQPEASGAVQGGAAQLLAAVPRLRSGPRFAIQEVRKGCCF